MAWLLRVEPDYIKIVIAVGTSWLYLGEPVLRGAHGTFEPGLVLLGFRPTAA
jgi:hypothetical protein